MAGASDLLSLDGGEERPCGLTTVLTCAIIVRLCVVYALDGEQQEQAPTNGQLSTPSTVFIQPYLLPEQSDGLGGYRLKLLAKANLNLDEFFGDRDGLHERDVAQLLPGHEAELEVSDLGAALDEHADSCDERSEQ